MHDDIHDMFSVLCCKSVLEMYTQLKTPKTREKVGVALQKLQKLLVTIGILPSTFYLVAFYCIMLDTSTLNIIY